MYVTAYQGVNIKGYASWSASAPGAGCCFLFQYVMGYTQYFRKDLGTTYPIPLKPGSTYNFVRDGQVQCGQVFNPPNAYTLSGWDAPGIVTPNFDGVAGQRMKSNEACPSPPYPFGPQIIDWTPYQSFIYTALFQSCLQCTGPNSVAKCALWSFDLTITQISDSGVQKCDLSFAS